MATPYQPHLPFPSFALKALISSLTRPLYYIPFPPIVLIYRALQLSALVSCPRLGTTIALCKSASEFALVVRLSRGLFFLYLTFNRPI